MMKTLVVGNSLDVLPIIDKILSDNKDGQITLFTTEGVLPYDRSLLPALIAGTITEKQLFKAPETLLAIDKNKVVASESLARISVKRRYLTTEKKTQINYDRLVLVDTGSLILPPVKGHQRSGVYDCWRLSSIKNLKKALSKA